MNTEQTTSSTDYVDHRQKACKHVRLGTSYLELASLYAQEKHPLREQAGMLIQLVEQVVRAELQLVELSATMTRRLAALNQALTMNLSIWDRFGQTGADLDAATTARDQAYQSLAYMARVFAAAAEKLAKQGKKAD